MFTASAEKFGLGFERDLPTVPLLRRIDLGTYTVEDSSVPFAQPSPTGHRGVEMDHPCGPAALIEIMLKSVQRLLLTAVDEHRDYELLERDYVASGGRVEDIQAMERNLGSEALHGYLMHRSSRTQPNRFTRAQCGSSEGLG